MYRSRSEKSSLFQSTLPLRGATGVHSPHLPITRFQSTLPLRGATKQVLSNSCGIGFQSTLPLRGATIAEQRVFNRVLISIHAPLTGSDVVSNTIALEPN